MSEGRQLGSGFRETCFYLILLVYFILFIFCSVLFLFTCVISSVCLDRFPARSCS